MSSPTLTLSDAPEIEFPDSGIAEMPLIRGVNHVLVKALDSDGRPNTFFLDTGASYSVVTSRFKGRTVDLEPEGELSTAIGVQGPIPVASIPLSVEDVAIGDLCLKRFGAVRMDVPGLDDFFGREIHGILGFNVLKHWLTAIDFRRERLALIDPSKADSLGWPEPNFVLPFSLHLGAVIRLDGLVNGRPTAFVLDIGSSYSILNGAAARASGIEFEPDQEVVGSPLEQGLPMDVGVAESLVVGSLALIRPRVWTFDMPPFVTLELDQEPAALLGNDLLARFRVLIDYSRKELRLWNGT